MSQDASFEWNRCTWGPGGWVLIALSFAVGFANFPLQVLGTGFDHLPGDAADNRLNNYVLEHGYRYLTGRAGAFWDAPMFYPTRHVTAWSDAHIGMQPVYCALRTSGLAPERAFQGYFAASFVLNFAAAVWAIRRLGFGAAGAAAGAYIFAFALPLAAQLPHVQLFPRFFVPPAVVFAWEFLRDPRARRLAAAAACWVAQTYLTIYIGYFLAILLLIGGGVALIRYRHQLPWDQLLRPGRREWRLRGIAIGGAGVAVLPMMIPHGMSVGDMPRDFLKDAAPKPGSWLTPPPNAAAFPELAEWTRLGNGMPDAGEQQLFPGFTPLVAVTLGLIAIAIPARFGGTLSTIAVAATTSVLIGLAVTRFGEFWIYEGVTTVPGTGGIRVVGRIVLVLLFPAAIIIAGGVDRMVSLAWRLGTLPAAITATLALALVAADQWLTSPAGARAKGWEAMRYSLTVALARQERLAAAMRAGPIPKMVYVFPSLADGPLGPMGLQLEAMRASQDLGIPCVNGWSGYLPAGWRFYNDYRSLMHWLSERSEGSEKQWDGLVLVGEPVPDDDPDYDAAMRRRFPPRLVR